MNYVKGILSAFAAIVIAAIACLWVFFPAPFPTSPPQPITNSGGGTTATDPSAFLKMLTHNLHSPLFWIIAGLLFGLFFAASRSTTIWRVCFFWIPTLTVSTLTIASAGLYTYLWIHFRNQ